MTCIDINSSICNFYLQLGTKPAEAGTKVGKMDRAVPSLSVRHTHVMSNMPGRPFFVLEGKGEETQSWKMFGNLCIRRNISCKMPTFAQNPFQFGQSSIPPPNGNFSNPIKSKRGAGRPGQKLVAPNLLE